MRFKLCNVLCVLELLRLHALHYAVQLSLHGERLVDHSDAESEDGIELRLCKLHHLRNVTLPALPADLMCVRLRSNGESQTVAHRYGVLSCLEGVFLLILDYCYAAISHLAFLPVQKFYQILFCSSRDYKGIAKLIVLR